MRFLKEIGRYLALAFLFAIVIRIALPLSRVIAVPAANTHQTAATTEFQSPTEMSFVHQPTAEQNNPFIAELLETETILELLDKTAKYSALIITFLFFFGFLNFGLQIPPRPIFMGSGARKRYLLVSILRI